MESLYLGCITFSRAHFADGQLTDTQCSQAELAALQELEPVPNVSGQVAGRRPWARPVRFGQ